MWRGPQVLWGAVGCWAAGTGPREGRGECPGPGRSNQVVRTRANGDSEAPIPLTESWLFAPAHLSRFILELLCWLSPRTVSIGMAMVIAPNLCSDMGEGWDCYKTVSFLCKFLSAMVQGILLRALPHGEFMCVRAADLSQV